MAWIRPLWGSLGWAGSPQRHPASSRATRCQSRAARLLLPESGPLGIVCFAEAWQAETEHTWAGAHLPSRGLSWKPSQFSHLPPWLGAATETLGFRPAVGRAGLAPGPAQRTPPRLT